MSDWANIRVEIKDLPKGAYFTLVEDGKAILRKGDAVGMAVPPVNEMGTRFECTTFESDTKALYLLPTDRVYTDYEMTWQINGQ